MIIVSQDRDKITESLELSIIDTETCKNIFIDKSSWNQFRKITNKKDDWCDIKELKGLGALIGIDMTMHIYTIVETKTNRILGKFAKEEKAKEILEDIVNKSEKLKKYVIPTDETLSFQKKVKKL